MAGGHLLVAPGLGTSSPLAELVARLARRHRVHAHDPGLGPPAAVLCRPRSTWLRIWGDAPMAWWIEHPSELPGGGNHRLRLVLTWPPVLHAAPDRVRGLGVPVEVVPAPAIDGSQWRPVMPFVRKRWRRRLGLPADLVARVGVAGGPTLDDDTAADALFLCAAAVVGPGHVLRSLALGTPTVCDAAVADLVGAVDGEHVVVADASWAPDAAAELAADMERAARLGRAGRRLIEQRHDLAASARRVAAVLSLPGVGPPPLAAVAGMLEGLGTPVGAPISARLAGAIGTLGGRSAEVTTRSLRW